MTADSHSKWAVRMGFYAYKVCKMLQAHAGADQCKQQDILEQRWGKSTYISNKPNSSGMWPAETGEHLLSWAAQHKAQLLMKLTLKGGIFSFFLFSEHLLREAG